MNYDQLSDDALRLWGCYFQHAKNTLRFGGDGAEMEITPMARAALNELLDMGVVVPTDPDDSWPNREHYKSAGIDLLSVLIERSGGTALEAFKWLTEQEFIIFQKKST